MARLLADDLDPNLCVDIRVQPHCHSVKPEGLDRLAQLDAPAVYVDPLLRQPLGNVVSRDRPEQLTLFARLAGHRQRDLREPVREGLGLCALRLDPAAPRFRLGRDPLLVARGGFKGEPLGKQEVAGVAGSHPDQLSDPAERLHIFTQDHFDHRSNPPGPEAAGRPRKCNQESARPRSVSPATTNGKGKKAISPTNVVVRRGTRPAPAPTTASPRVAYRATATSSRFAPTSPRAGTGGKSTSARPATGSQTI